MHSSRQVSSSQQNSKPGHCKDVLQGSPSPTTPEATKAKINMETIQKHPAKQCITADFLSQRNSTLSVLFYIMACRVMRFKRSTAVLYLSYHKMYRIINSFSLNFLFYCCSKQIRTAPTENFLIGSNWKLIFASTAPYVDLGAPLESVLVFGSFRCAQNPL